MLEFGQGNANDTSVGIFNVIRLDLWQIDGAKSPTKLASSLETTDEPFLTPVGQAYCYA